MVAYGEVTGSSTHSFWMAACVLLGARFTFICRGRKVRFQNTPTDTPAPTGYPVTCYEGTEGRQMLYPNSFSMLDGGERLTPHPSTFYPDKEERYAFNNRLGGPVWTFCTQKKKTLAPVRIRTPDRLSRNLVTTLTELSRPDSSIMLNFSPIRASCPTQIKYLHTPFRNKGNFVHNTLQFTSHEPNLNKSKSTFTNRASYI